MSDDDYDILCEQYNQKYQCMLTNDVIIVKSSEVADIAIYAQF